MKAKKNHDLDPELEAFFMKRFKELDLKPCYRPQALLMLKGLVVAEIAKLEFRSIKTIKLRNWILYRHFGVYNNKEFVNKFYSEAFEFYRQENATLRALLYAQQKGSTSKTQIISKKGTEGSEQALQVAGNEAHRTFIENVLKLR